MRSTKRSAAKNSGATNSGTSVLSFFEQPIKSNDTKQQRLNKLVTRQAMEIKLLQKENEALRMENEIFKEATDKHASSLTKLQSKIKSLQRSLTNAQQPAKKKQRTMSTWLNSGGKWDTAQVQKMAKQTRSDIVNKMGAEIVTKANGNQHTGVELIEALLQHKHMRALVTNSGYLNNDDAAQSMLIDRLADALKKLRKSARTLHEWKANQVLLTAIAPPPDSPDMEKIIAALLKVPPSDGEGAVVKTAWRRAEQG